MNKKGFTLVEVLIVIVLLGAIMAIAIPAVMGSKTAAIDALSNQEKKNIEDAALILAMDLDDDMSDIYNCKNESWITSKCTKQNSLWTKITNLSLDDLKTHGYFEDNANHCSGSVTIDHNNGNYQVTLNNVKCN